jgi:hypothetical protein
LGENKLLNLCGNQHKYSSKKLKIELLYDPNIPLLVYAPKIQSQLTTELSAYRAYHAPITIAS